MIKFERSAVYLDGEFDRYVVYSYDDTDFYTATATHYFEDQRITTLEEAKIKLNEAKRIR